MEYFFLPLHNSSKRSHTEHNCLSRTNEGGTLAPLPASDFSCEDKQGGDGVHGQWKGEWFLAGWLWRLWNSRELVPSTPRKAISPGWLRSTEIFYCPEMGQVPTDRSHPWQAVWVCPFTVKRLGEGGWPTWALCAGAAMARSAGQQGWEASGHSRCRAKVVRWGLINFYSWKRIPAGKNTFSVNLFPQPDFKNPKQVSMVPSVLVNKKAMITELETPLRMG